MLLTYANQLTILRMLFVPCFVILLLYGYPKMATLLFLIAGITDGLDGLLARKLKQKTALGSFLDPMADKLLLAAAFVTLSIPSVPLALHIPTWLTVLTISRDFLCAFSAGHPPSDAAFRLPAEPARQMHHRGSAGNSRRLHAGLSTYSWRDVFPLTVYPLWASLVSGLHSLIGR